LEIPRKDQVGMAMLRLSVTLHSHNRIKISLLKMILSIILRISTVATVEVKTGLKLGVVEAKIRSSLKVATKTPRT
jgi:hypothetical protein